MKLTLQNYNVNNKTLLSLPCFNTMIIFKNRKTAFKRTDYLHEHSNTWYTVPFDNEMDLMDLRASTSCLVWKYLMVKIDDHLGDGNHLFILIISYRATNSSRSRTASTLSSEVRLTMKWNETTCTTYTKHSSLEYSRVANNKIIFIILK